MNAGTSGVYIADSSSNTVDGNTIDGSGRWGIDVSPSDDVKTRNNVISNNLIRNTSQQTNDTGAIYAWAGSVPNGANLQLTITGNRIENTGGLDRDGSGNYTQQGSSQGIYLDDHVGGVTMTKNVIETGGFGLFLCHGCTGVSAANNLVVLQSAGLYDRGANGTTTATQDMNFNGTLTFDLLPSYFSAAANPTVVVQLSGTPAAGVGAHFNVLVDGTVVGGGTATGSVAQYVFATPLAAHSHHQIGLQLDNGADSGTSSRALHNIVFFINNTAVLPNNVPAAFLRVAADDLATSNFSLTHNILYRHYGPGQELLDYTPSQLPGYLDPHPGTVDYNLRYQQVTAALDSSFGSQALDAHSNNADPSFAAAGAGDYSLQAGSPAAGVGFVSAGVPLSPAP